MNARFKTGLRRETLGSEPKYLIPLPPFLCQSKPASFANHLPLVMTVWQGNECQIQNRLAP
jgi:hypothetical protein